MGAIPGPIMLPSVPSGIGPGRAETDCLAERSSLKSKQQGNLTKARERRSRGHYHGGADKKAKLSQV